MTTKLFSLAGTIVLCSTIAAPAQTALTDSVLNKRVRDGAAALLAQRVESVDWVETTFEEVIDWLRDLSDDKVNIIPRWTALDVDGVGRESLVTLKLTDAYVYEILNEVLIQLSDDDTLGYHALRNNLKISSKQDFNKRQYMRIYDATDILNRPRNFGQESPQIDLQRSQVAGGGGGQSVFSGGSGGGGGGGLRGGRQSEQELEDKLEEIRVIIQTAIAPSTWAITSGRRNVSAAPAAGLGTISIYNNSLVIYATAEVHEMIAGYFAFGG